MFEENLNNENIGSEKFETALTEFIDAFVDVPYDQMTPDQKELADKAKQYMDSRRPHKDTLH